VYVPCFGLCADYVALLARPLTRRATAGWARQAAYRKPPSRKERKVSRMFTHDGSLFRVRRRSRSRSSL
jgi:hypothetical protein